jgi:hypothetical protein
VCRQRYTVSHSHPRHNTFIITSAPADYFLKPTLVDWSSQKNLGVMCYVAAWYMEAVYQRVRHAWPEFLQASVAGVAKSFALSTLKLSKFVAAHHSILPVVTSGVIAAAVFLVARRSLRDHRSDHIKGNTDDRGRGRFRSFPPLRGSDDAAGFTATSIRTRLPRVIEDIIATMPSLPAVAVEKLRLLQAEISLNAIISSLPEASAPMQGEHVPGSNDADLEPDWPSLVFCTFIL